MSTVQSLKGIKGPWVKMECPSYACLWDSRFLSQASLSPVSWETSGDMFYIGEHTRINSFLYSGACHNTLLFLTFSFFHLTRDPGDCSLFIHTCRSGCTILMTSLHGWPVLYLTGPLLMHIEVVCILLLFQAVLLWISLHIKQLTKESRSGGNGGA